MKKRWISAAFILACLMTVVHIFVGGRLIASPLLESDLPDLARLTLYLCWHGITIVLAGMAGLFALPLFRGPNREALTLGTGLALSFFVLGWTMIVACSVSPLTLPQWIIFGPMSVCGLMAIRSERTTSSLTE